MVVEDAGADAVAVVAETGSSIEWFAVTRGADPMLFPPDASLRPIETDAQTAVLRVSEDGATVAVEYLRMLDDAHYENRGFLLTNGQKVGSWDLELHRKE